MAGKNANLSPDAPEMQMQQLKESKKQFKQEENLNMQQGMEVFEMAYDYFCKALDIRRSGSAALDLCAIAAGRAEVYFELILRHSLEADAQFSDSSQQERIHR